MMATYYSNKQNLENHWLTPTSQRFCQLPCPAYFGLACVHLSQPLKLGVFHTKVQTPGLLRKKALWPQQLFSASVSCSLRPCLACFYSPKCPV